MIGGTKTAAVRAGCTFNVVHYATDWEVHLSHPLVKLQIKPRAGVGDIAEKSEGALTPSVEIIMQLETMVTTGVTAQIRALAGFFLCLTFGSSRTTHPVVQGLTPLH